MKQVQLCIQAHSSSLRCGGSLCKDNTMRHSEGAARRISFPSLRAQRSNPGEKIADKPLVFRDDMLLVKCAKICHRALVARSMDCFANARNDASCHSYKANRRSKTRPGKSCVGPVEPPII